MTTVSETAVPLVFTDSAANKVKELIEEEGNAALKLRVFVTGAGIPGVRVVGRGAAGKQSCYAASPGDGCWYG